MGILYLNNEGTVVRKDGGRYLIESKSGELSIPIEQVSAVILISGTHLTEAVVTEMLKRGTSVTYLSSRGQYYGRLEPIQSIDADRQLKQARLLDNDEFCTTLTKEFISAKIHNSYVILKWFNRHHPDVILKNVDDIKILENKVVSSNEIESIRGFEGVAAKLYFEDLSRLCRPDFRFSGRSRQPPKDPFNSLLSYGYTLLMYEFYTLFSIHSLNPYFGFFHKTKRGHPALASDMMEEWRPVLIDSYVLHLANKNTFKPVDFETNHADGGVYLNREQSKIFLKKYEERVLSQKTNDKGEAFNYRNQMENQIRLIIRAIEEKDASIYKAYRIN